MKRLLASRRHGELTGTFISMSLQYFPIHFPFNMAIKDEGVADSFPQISSPKLPFNLNQIQNRVTDDSGVKSDIIVWELLLEMSWGMLLSAGQEIGGCNPLGRCHRGCRLVSNGHRPPGTSFTYWKWRKSPRINPKGR